ncbi:hypothetical protein ABC347_13775 [Sphingomonas sp. 1P06PA]|uniref:hypothetical protein n=1 Tax=Sphingomonas sp. 1P06PA TaxID=554121 RepID=UPI0039A616B7
MGDEQDLESLIRAGAAERDYLFSRAEAHGHLADKSELPETRAIHLRLQQLYRERGEACE